MDAQAEQAAWVATANTVVEEAATVVEEADMVVGARAAVWEVVETVAAPAAG